MAKKEAKTKKENSKNKKSFFKSFKAELKKVTWPTPKQLFNNTIAVITIVFITAAIVFVLDLAFETLNKYGVNKVKEVMITEEAIEDTATDNTTETTEEGNTVEENTVTSTEEEHTEENAE